MRWAGAMLLGAVTGLGVVALLARPIALPVFVFAPPAASLVLAFPVAILLALFGGVRRSTVRGRRLERAIELLARTDAARALRIAAAGEMVTG